MGAVTVLLVVARGKQSGCEEEEGQRERERHTHTQRETGIERVAGRQTDNDEEKAGRKHS
jgi:hypothetical protein